MMLYYLPLVPLFIGLLIPVRSIFINDTFICTTKSIFFYLFLFIIFILTGFKGNIDPDYQNYKFYYDIIPALDKLDGNALFNIKIATSSVELSVVYGMSLLKTLGLEFQFYYIFSSLCFVFLMSYLSKYYKYNECVVGLVLYCFYIQPFFIQVRYFCGVLCGLICLMEFFQNKKINVKVIVFMGIGFLFHTVVIFIIPVMIGKPLYKFIRHNLLISFLIPFAFLFINIDLLLQYTSIISGRYVNYLASSSIQNEVGNVFSFYIRESLVIVLLLFIFLTNKNSFSKILNVANAEALIFMLLAMLSIWAFAWQFGMLYRIALLFEFGWILFMLQSRKNISSYLSWIVLILYMLWRLYSGLAELKAFEFC